MIALMAFAMETHAQWKAYLSYYEPTEIEQTPDGMLYVLASGGLFSYSTQDQEVRTYDKTTLLSDGDIAHIAWCKAANSSSSIAITTSTCCRLTEMFLTCRLI